MVAGQPIKTDVVNDAYEQGWERAFGKSSGQRGRWIWDPVQKKLVEPHLYRQQERALDAPIMVDRHMEGLSSPVDGSDIGSRRKRKEHMKRHGLVDAEDYKGVWAKAAEERALTYQGKHPGQRKELRETLARTWYERTGY